MLVRFIVLMCVSLPALAGYTPDLVEFDGEQALVFAAVDEMYISDGGTIEFWVVPDWIEAPAYDPVVLSNAGTDGASYLVAVLRDRDGLGIVSGDAELMVPFDFTDAQLHHVALSYFEDQLAVYIDGRLAVSTEFTMMDLPAAGLWIGTADGSTAPFVGAVAGLRIWGRPVAQEDLVRFAAADVLDASAGHPDIAYLRAISAFDDADLLVPTSDEQE